MQTAQVKTLYNSGFPKNVSRNKYNLKINERLKSARNRKEMSAMGVVKALKKRGVSIGHSTLQGYEAEEASLNHRYPSLPVLIELADFYGCSTDFLFGLTERYKTYDLNPREVDIRDVLESKGSVAYNSKKLTKRQRELIAEFLDEFTTEL